MTDRRLLKLVKDFRAGILEGATSRSMCFAVCAPLSSFLGMMKVPTKIKEGMVVTPGGWESNHFWLELEDGRVLDPTADQFDDPSRGRAMPPVYLGPRPAWYLKTDKELTS